MIPKIIHQIFPVDNIPRPLKLMKTWKIKGYEHKVWTEEDLFKMGIENIDQYNFYKHKGIWSGAVDVARVEVLKNYGGLYVDCDMERLQPIDELLQDDIFLMFTWERNHTQRRLFNGIMGAIPNHPLFIEYTKMIGKAKKLIPAWNTIGSKCLTELASKHNLIKKAYPYYTFLPTDYNGNTYKGEGKVYGTHYWATTNNLYHTL